jgi:endoglucanase
LWYNSQLKRGGYYEIQLCRKCLELKGLSSHSVIDFSEVVTYENLKKLKEGWGINCFRVAMYTDPNINGYVLTKEQNKANAIKIIDMCEQLGIYAVMDWHTLNDGNPQTYQAEAIEFFNEISEKYKENPFLIYEICNEPNNCTWVDNVKPYAEEVIKTIRNNSPKAMIWVGVPGWGKNIGEAKASPIEAENIAYTFHFYAGSMADDYRRNVDKCLEEKFPIVVSECGITDLTGNGEIYKEEFAKWIDYLNSHEISWIFWQFSNKEEGSSVLAKEYEVRKKVIGIPANADENKTTENTTVEPQEVWIETNYDINNYLTETGKYIKEMLSREAPLSPITIPEANEVDTNTTNVITENTVTENKTENSVNTVESDLFKELQNLLNQ